MKSKEAQSNRLKVYLRKLIEYIIGIILLPYWLWCFWYITREHDDKELECLK